MSLSQINKTNKQIKTQPKPGRELLLTYSLISENWNAIQLLVPTHSSSIKPWKKDTTTVWNKGNKTDHNRHREPLSLLLAKSWPSIQLSIIIKKTEKKHASINSEETPEQSRLKFESCLYHLSAASYLISLTLSFPTW